METYAQQSRSFRQQRRALLSRHAQLCGVELARAEKTGSHWVLKVYFVPVDAAVVATKKAAPEGLEPHHFRIFQLDGGGPVPRVETIDYSRERDDLVEVHLGGTPSEEKSSAEEESPYVLKLEGVPHLSPDFSSAFFALRPSVAMQADEPLPSETADARAAEAQINYLAKDYQSFLMLMLNHLSLVLPDWRERHAADLGVALMELLAYAGDYLSYYQDAVATEAYLSTARSRVSLRRHARLCDYRVDDGCNARVWVQVGVLGDEVPLPTGTRVAVTRGSDSTAAVVSAPLPGDIIFETMHPAVLREAHNLLPIYDWDVDAYSIEQGATRTALDGHFPALEAGETLIFEEIASPATGRAADADPRRRHAVRLTRPPVRTTDVLTARPITLLAWDASEALPFQLAVTARLPSSSERRTRLAAARGNVVLADHGATHPPRGAGSSPGGLRLIRETDGRARVPPVSDGVLWAAPYNHKKARSHPAAAAIDQEYWRAVPCIDLMEYLGDSPAPPRCWRGRLDLLSSSRYAPDFVAETESNGQVSLRFGDGVCGRKPSPDAELRAAFRVGRWQEGNIAADTLSHLIGTDFRVVAVRNPLPARGARPPESVEHIRLHAVEELGSQRRCVTPSDHADAARRHPEVRQASARPGWTGSESTVLLYVVRRGGLPVDNAFRQRLASFLNPLRLIGAGFEIQEATFVSIFLSLDAVLESGYAWPSVRKRLADALGAGTLADGTRGFFHPDNFSFGQPLYLSQVLAHAGAVPGVARLTPRAFQRWRRDAGAAVRECIEMGELELPRFRNDHNRPQHGILRLQLEGEAR